MTGLRFLSTCRCSAIISSHHGVPTRCTLSRVTELPLCLACSQLHREGTRGAAAGARAAAAAQTPRALFYPLSMRQFPLLQPAAPRRHRGAAAGARAASGRAPVRQAGRPGQAARPAARAAPQGAAVDEEPPSGLCIGCRLCRSGLFGARQADVKQSAAGMSRSGAACDLWHSRALA